MRDVAPSLARRRNESEAATRVLLGAWPACIWHSPVHLSPFAPIKQWGLQHVESFSFSAELVLKDSCLTLSYHGPSPSARCSPSACLHSISPYLSLAFLSVFLCVCVCVRALSLPSQVGARGISATCRHVEMPAGPAGTGVSTIITDTACCVCVCVCVCMCVRTREQVRARKSDRREGERASGRKGERARGKLACERDRAREGERGREKRQVRVRAREGGKA